MDRLDKDDEEESDNSPASMAASLWLLLCRLRLEMAGFLIWFDEVDLVVVVVAVATD